MISVRLRLALTVLITGLATAVGVLVTVALAFERLEREAAFARADAFIGRVVAQNDDLLAQQRRDPEHFTQFLRSLLLFDPDNQLYLLAADGRVLARTGVTPLPPQFRVSVPRVQEAVEAGAAARAQAGTGTRAGAAAVRRAAYVMGDDPEYMDSAAVVAARALREPAPDMGPNIGQGAGAGAGAARDVGPGAADPSGFLYVVCRKPGLPPSRLAQLGSHLAGPAVLPVVAVVVLATLLAAWLLGAMTRPLTVLSREVDAAARAGFEGETPSLLRAPPPAPGRDEIGRLRHGFAELLRRLRAQWDELRRLDAFRRESVSNLSHDLRSPLTAAVASLETLQQRWAGDEARAADGQLLAVALRNSHTAARLVRALGDLAVLDEASYELRLLRLDLAEVLDDIVTRFAERSRAAGVELRLDLGAGAGEALPAAIDVELFERALANLLDNALQHTARGGRIAVSARLSGPMLEVSVTDNGSGIAPEHLARLFDRHFQGRKEGAEPDPRSSGHLGLGLAIVQRIAQLHGGEATVHSSLGAGTRVTLLWPAHPAQPAHPARSDGPAGGAAPAGPASD